MKSAILLVALFAAGAAGAAQPHVDKAKDRRHLVETVVRLATEMAANASKLDVGANAHLIPDTDKVVYVSFGSPITGKEYLATLSQSYAQRKSQNHTWDRWEVTPISDNAAVFTGWATMTSEAKDGKKVVQKVIFTEVFAKTTAGWKRVIAQKSLLDED